MLWLNLNKIGEKYTSVTMSKVTYFIPWETALEKTQLNSRKRTLKKTKMKVNGPGK